MANLLSVVSQGAFVFGYDTPVLKLDQGGLIVLSGPNGSGKSSIMNSIAQSMFCKNDTTGDGDDIVNKTLDDGCRIATDFEVKGTVYRAEYLRKFRREGSKARETDLYLWEKVGDSFVDKRGASMADTAKKIQTLIGMDFSQFMATSYMGIQSASLFLNGTDSQRMSIITPFLGLGVWDSIQEKVRALKKSVAEDLHKSKGQYDTIVSQLETVTSRVLDAEARARVESQIADLELRLEDSKIDLERELSSSTELSNKIQILQTDIDRLINENGKLSRDEIQIKNDLKRTIDRIASSSPQVDRTALDQIRAELVQAETMLKSTLVGARRDLAMWNGLIGKPLIRACDKAAKLMEQHNALDAQIVSLTTVLNGLEDSLHSVLSGEGECPTCHQIATAEHLSQVREQIEAEISSKSVELDSAKSKQKNLFDKAMALAEAFKKSEIERITKMVEDANSATPEVADFRERIAAEEARIESQIQNWRKDQEKEASDAAKANCARILDSIGVNNAKIQDLNQQCAELEADPSVIESKTRIGSLRASIEHLTNEIDRNEQLIKDSDMWAKEQIRLEKQAQEVSSKLHNLETKQEDVEFLDRHTGDKGIKRFKLRDCIEFMNDRLSFYMGIMGLSMRVWFQDRELKKSAIKKKPDQLTDDDWTDRFEIFIADGDKSGVPAGMYSGGERTLVSLAVLGTLWETANTFGSGGSNILMVDEPFGLLQEDNRDRALALFEHWANMNKTVLVSDNTGTISKMRYTQMWEMHKTNHTSQIVVKDW